MPSILGPLLAVISRTVSKVRFILAAVGGKALDVCGIRGQEKDGGVFRCSIVVRYVGIRKCGLVGTIPDMETIR